MNSVTLSRTSIESDEVIQDNEQVLIDDILSVERMNEFLASTPDFTESTSSTPDFAESTSLSPPSSEMELPRRRDGKRAYQRPKKELDYLRKKHTELAERLAILQERLAMHMTSGPWKMRAIEQAHSLQRSLMDNTRLKFMVQEQLSVIQALERVLQKQPKFCNFPASEGLWRHAILGEQNREQDMEMLMKHQYDRLESILIREGLYAAMERGEDLQKSCVLSGDDEEAMRIVFVGSKSVPLSFDTMGSLIWQNKCIQPTGATVIEYIHPNLVHIREDMKLPDSSMPMLEAHFVCRKYEEANRIVIVWRSIVEDQLIPHAKGHLISNREGWSVVTAKNSNECYTQIYISTATPIFPPALHSIQPAVGTLTELLLKATTENKMKFKSVLFGAVQRQQQLTSGT